MENLRLSARRRKGMIPCQTILKDDNCLLVRWRCASAYQPSEWAQLIGEGEEREEVTRFQCKKQVSNHHFFSLLSIIYQTGKKSKTVLGMAVFKSSVQLVEYTKKVSFVLKIAAKQESLNYKVVSRNYTTMKWKNWMSFQKNPPITNCVVKFFLNLHFNPLQTLEQTNVFVC